MSLRAARAIGIVFLTALTFAAAFPTTGQGKSDLELRTIHGTVLNKDENPVPGSVVYLLNVKTQSVKTYIADDQGIYRFSGLDPNVDYEVHAEHDDLTSSTRTVSSFDSRRDIEANLRLSRPKKNTH